MYTAWHTAGELAQLETDSVAYTDNDGALDRVTDITTVLPLQGNAMSNGVLITREANSLVFSRFGFAIGTATVVGIEIALHVARLSRIQDRTVQLYMAQPTGANLANVAAEDVAVYGGDLATWDIVNTVMDYASTAFGCVIDLAPHRLYPSRNTATIRSVAMRLQLA